MMQTDIIFQYWISRGVEPPILEMPYVCQKKVCLLLQVPWVPVTSRRYFLGEFGEFLLISSYINALWEIVRISDQPSFGRTRLQQFGCTVQRNAPGRLATFADSDILFQEVQH